MNNVELKMFFFVVILRTNVKFRRGKKNQPQLCGLVAMCEYRYTFELPIIWNLQQIVSWNTNMQFLYFCVITVYFQCRRCSLRTLATFGLMLHDSQLTRQCGIAAASCMAVCEAWWKTRATQGAHATHKHSHRKGRGFNAEAEAPEVMRPQPLPRALPSCFCRGLSSK